MDSIELKKAINDIGFAKALKENLSISEKKIPGNKKKKSLFFCEKMLAFQGFLCYNL